jgi:hypothetical protein
VGVAINIFCREWAGLSLITWRKHGNHGHANGGLLIEKDLSAPENRAKA